jgi:uncharacterized protein YbjT (DUF2867 family)
MKVLLTGATGMVGRGVLLEALDDPGITSVLTLGRRKTGEAHPKLREIEHADLLDLTSVRDQLTACDACLFCLGVSSVGMSETEYARVTVDMTVAVATTFLAANPHGSFVFVSGQGTDSTEKGRVMWARVKGRAENALLAMPFRSATMFRPGVIQPERGITSRTTSYRVLYALAKPLMGMLVRSGVATTTTLLGLAMLEAVEHPPPARRLENREITALGRQRLARRGSLR